MNEKSPDIPRRALFFGIGSFVIGMLILRYVGGWAQYNFGMVGLVITELLILAIAVVSALGTRLDLRQVFRFRRSSGREWFASLTIYLSAFFGAAAISYLLSFFFPQINETSQFINNFILSGGLILALVGVSILPGICEEAWHRGFLLTSIGSLRSVAVRVLIMGIVFGLFHEDATRFLQTMILGFALSFMRIKTDNLLVPMVFHSLNNLISVALTFLASGIPQNLPEQTTQEIQATSSQMSLEMLIPIVIFTVALSVLFLALGRFRFKQIDALRATQLAP